MTEKFGPNVAEAGSLLANKFGEEAKAKRHEAAIALEEAEKAKAENNNETNRALVKQARDNFETASREAKEWETGGNQRLVIDSALNVISTALAGRPAAEVVASGLSPAVNNQIKKATTDAKGNVNTALNLTAHALWGAVEAYAGNRNVVAGAAGAAGGEAAAHFLASTLYDKSPEKLSEEEKRTVSSLSQVAAGIAGGSLSDSSDGAIIAAKTAKDAVENNYLKPSDLVEAERKYKACKGDSDCEMRVVEETNELSKKRNQELDEYRQSLERELLAAKRSAEQQCAGNADCYLAYSQEANKHFKEQLNAYLAHVSEGNDFESLARNYYPDDAYFRSIWYGLTNSGPQKTKESLKSAKDYIDNTSFGEALDDTLRIGKKLVRLPKEWIEQDIPAHSVEKALREMTDGNPQDVGEVFFGLTTGAATVSVAGKTMKWIGGKWVRSPDVDYSRDNANIGKNNPKFNSDFNNNINTKPLAPKAIVKINGYYYADGMKISESSDGAIIAAKTAKDAVENNYLYNGEVNSLVKELAKAEKEGRDTKPIFEKYAKLSEKNRQEILKLCGNNPACYIPHIQMMQSGDEAAYENFSYLRLGTYFNNLSRETQVKLSDFVELENGKTRNQLPKSVHYATLALGAAEAVGLGGLALKAKLPKGANANEKLPIVGETKGYRTTKVNLNNLEIEISKQNKHLENTNEYKVSLANGQQKSIITVSLDSLKGYVGTGQQVGKTEIGLPGSKERVNFNKNIGIYIDPVTGDRTPTTMGIIHYSKNGYHVVPAKPKE